MRADGRDIAQVAADRLALFHRGRGSRRPEDQLDRLVASPAGYLSDNLINNEIGLKSEFFDHRVLFNASIYQMDWKNVQLLANVGGFGVNTNGGKAKSSGLEGSVSWALSTELTVTANAAYTEAKLTQGSKRSMLDIRFRRGIGKGVGSKHRS